MGKIWFRPVWTRALVAGALACGSDPERGFSRLGDDVEWEGWVDTARPLRGDGATSFDSFPRASVEPEQPLQPWRPNFHEERGIDVGPRTSVVGDHLLSLSRFRGLVSTRLAGADAPQLEASVPLDGLPVGVFVSEGVAVVTVLDPEKPGCALGDCIAEQTSRVVLVDVADPANPVRLGEQRIAGTVAAARQVGSVLHVLSRELVRCALCESEPRLDFTWFAFDRSSPRELPAPRETPLARDALFAGDWLIDLALTESATASVLRVADLSSPEPALSATVTLPGRARQAQVSGDRLLVTYDRAQLEIETFALDSGSPQSIGYGALAAPDAESFGWLTFDGERAVTQLSPSGRLAVLDLSEAGAPELGALVDVQLAEAEFAMASDRVIAVGRSTEAPPTDSIPAGPRAAVLIDVANVAAPRVLDRTTVGSFDSIGVAPPVLTAERAHFRYYEASPGSTEVGACGRSAVRLVGYDLATDSLASTFAFEAIDADASVVNVGDDWWLASSVSVSRYRPAAAAASPLARVELTRWVSKLQPLGAGLALFGLDFSTNAPTLALGSSAVASGVEAELDFAAAAGLAPLDCDEQRRWAAPAAERDGNLYALRIHRPAPAEPRVATVHGVDPSAPTALAAASLELEPLVDGEGYLGVLAVERALLVARGPDVEAGDSSSDPTAIETARWYDSPWRGDPGDSPWEPERAGAPLAPVQRAYDVIDLGDPAAPSLAGRLEIEPAVAEGGFFRGILGVTRDTPSGFQDESSRLGPAVISGAILAGSHVERSSSGPFRFYLDRFDLSTPSAPVALAPIEIPGSVLAFDADTGELITLDALRLDDVPRDSRCEVIRRARGAEPWVCSAQRRALSGLIIEGDRASRVGRVVLDTGEREPVRFAVSGGTVYYVTQPAGMPIMTEGPFAARDISLQRVVMRDGRMERLPSLDISAAFRLSPKVWTQFAARGDRALWVAGAQLFVADFSEAEPQLAVHEIGVDGCDALALQGDMAYCAQGPAGFVAIALGSP